MTSAYGVDSSESQASQIDKDWRQSEGNIINIDKDEGLAISIVTNIVEPKQLTLEESLERVKSENCKRCK